MSNWVHNPTLFGSQNKQAKLDENKVKVIRKLMVDGVAQSIIAKRFGVSKGAINAISTRRTWAHVK